MDPILVDDCKRPFFVDAHLPRSQMQERTQHITDRWTFRFVPKLITFHDKSRGYKWGDVERSTSALILIPLLPRQFEGIT